MIDDIRSLDARTIIDTDLCVIGAGPAGLALALQFLDRDVRVVVLESGGRDPAPATDMLNEGVNGGDRPLGLTAGRTRAFGGTSRTWAGQCIPLAPTDFKARPWVPYSGWPIGPTDLTDYYPRAERMLGITGATTYDESVYEKFHLCPPLLDTAKLRHVATVFTPTVDLGKVYQKPVERAGNVRVLLNATVTGLSCAPGSRVVQRASVRAADHTSYDVRTKAFVLCAGGIENAKLLLVSRDVGQDRDVIGRYLQDHPNGRAARIGTEEPQRLHDPYGLLYKGRLRYYPRITLTPEWQRREEVLSCAAMINADFEGSGVGAAKRVRRAIRDRQWPAWRAEIGRMAADVPQIVKMAHRRYARGLSPTSNDGVIWLQTYAEQAPNPESRVRLSDRTDAFGVPLPRVEWRLSELDRRTARVMVHTVADEFRRLGLGTVQPEAWLDATPDAWSAGVNDAYHPTGTTRMADDPKQGVVDRHCAVHGVSGLYVAGSSVFPIGGFANPTLTIVALATRLADHLKRTVFTGTPHAARK